MSRGEVGDKFFYLPLENKKLRKKNLIKYKLKLNERGKTKKYSSLCGNAELMFVSISTSKKKLSN